MDSIRCISNEMLALYSQVNRLTKAKDAIASYLDDGNAVRAGGLLGEILENCLSTAEMVRNMQDRLASDAWNKQRDMEEELQKKSKKS